MWPHEVKCVIQTPTPHPLAALRLVLALVFAFFMISAWDRFLDLVLKRCFRIRNCLVAAFVRAVIATLLAWFVLIVVDIDVDDAFGSVLED